MGELRFPQLLDDVASSICDTRIGVPAHDGATCIERGAAREAIMAVARVIELLPADTPNDPLELAKALREAAEGLAS